MEQTMKIDIQRKAQENATLIQELNQLRVQNKGTLSKVKTLELKLKSLEGGDAKQTQAAIDHQAAAPPPPAAPGMPRTPSGGALPGPRQRAQSPNEQTLALSLSTKTKPKKGGMMQSGASIEHEERLQSLQLTADVNSRQLQVQQEENKRLKNRMHQLLKGDA